eukprot:TRINITY_DN6712_c0_g1_i3.p1 TRINITY_DN6712_c0_g1~~TRINITY_DN6712_c0_g1_i3.p1  ORF type:complete len:535 (-),score=115.79 TRINITY_DN6712_c0_g1_i3:80-1684(-)
MYLRAIQSQTSPMPLLGVSAALLLQLQTEYGSQLAGKPLAAMLSEVVVPLTRSGRCSFTELVLSHPRVSELVGRATHFVSCSWDCTCADVFSALNDWFERSSRRTAVFFWLDVLCTNHHAPVTKTFEWQCSQLKKVISATGHVLAVLAPWDRPVCCSDAWRLFEFHAAVQSSTPFSLVAPASETFGLVEHIKRDPSRSQSVFAQLELDFSKARADLPSDAAKIAELVRTTIGVPNLKAALATAVRDWMTMVVRAAVAPDSSDRELLQGAACLLQSFGEYADALRLKSRVLVLCETSVPLDEAAVAAALNNLGLVHKLMGKSDEALSLYQRALSIEETAFGPDHLRIATTLNNIAVIFKSQKRVTEAYNFLQRSISITERHVGGSHPSLATALNNLAVVCEELSPAERERLAAPAPQSLYERALAMNEALLGHHHPDVATDLNNLAQLLQKQGKFHSALPLYSRALAIDEQVFGREHPAVATDLLNLGSLYYDMRNFAAARPLFERALAVRTKTLGPNHPETRSAANFLHFRRWP